MLHHVEHISSATVKCQNCQTNKLTSDQGDHGAYPSDLQYKGFPKSVMISINEVICHGIPEPWNA